MTALAPNTYPVTSNKAATGLKGSCKHANRKAVMVHALMHCRIPTPGTKIAEACDLDRSIAARQLPAFAIDGGGEKGKQGPIPNSGQARRRMPEKKIISVSGNDKPEQRLVVIYTDGACSGNPGPAGIGVVLEYRGKTWETSEYIGEATNNIAELKAVRAALSALKRKDLAVRLHTDSGYVHGLLTKGWAARKNSRLVEQIRGLLREFRDVQIVKVAGHSSIAGNERADSLAVSAIKKGGLSESTQTPD